MRDSKRDIILVIILMSIMGLIFTYPLILYFNTGIPFASFSGSDVPLLRTGDHLQLYYWFWLLKDNLFGGSALFSNPYEFNMIGKQVSQGYHMFPFSLLFLIFTPFGDIFAYNATVVLSFILVGVFMYLLAKLYTESRVAAFFSAIIFTLAPFRLSQMFSGHLNGFIFFFFPLIIYLFEVSIKKTSLTYAAFAGISIFSLSLMEFHLTYYLFILLGAYVPLRVLLYCRVKIGETMGGQHLVSSSRPHLKELALIIGIGILLAIFYQIAILRQYDYAFSIEHLLFALFIYPLFCLFVWLFFSSVLSFFTPLQLSQTLKVDAISYTPILLLLTYPIQFKFNIPHLETVLLLLSLGGVCVLKIYLFLKFRRKDGSHTFNLKSLKVLAITLLPVLLFMALSVFYLLYKKHSIFDASIVQGGRDLKMVYSFSPHLSDIFIRTNTIAENYIYLGIIPVGLTLFVLICLLSRPDDSFGNQKENKLLLSFFMLVMLVSYILSIGPSLTNSFPLYKLLYTYLPFFNFPRSSGRIVIVTFLALSILAGYGVKELQRRFEDLNKQRLFMVVIILSTFGIAADYYTFRLGITTLGHGNRIYRYVKENIGDKILLELPLWPGDSHQSSLYEYYTTIDQVKRVNGYSPVISKKYIDTVFWPLYSLNVGEIDEDQYKLLRKMDVKYITVHDNEEMWAHKASRYSPVYIVRRLTASPYLKFIDSNTGISLLEVRDEMASAQEAKKDRSLHRLISKVFPPNLLRRKTGELVGNLLWGSVERDRADFLTFGPYISYLPGGYLAYFRLKVEDNLSDEYVARIEVSSRLPEGEIILARKELRGRDFLKRGDFQDFYLFFNLDDKVGKLELRTYFYKKVDVWFDRAVVSSAENEFPPPYFEAEELPGDVGLVREDKAASNDRCVFGDRELHPPGYLIYGPNQRYPQGRYRAIFKIKADLTETIGRGGNKDIADIYVTSNLGENILAGYTINLNDIKEAGYNLIPLDFQIERPDELEFRVRFRGHRNLCVDKIEITNID